MHTRRQVFGLALAAVALFSLSFASGCSSQSVGGTASAPEPTAVLGGTGSTFIAPLMAKWVGAYHESHPTVQINYRAIGSGGGIGELKKGYLSFGASDAPLSDDQLKGMSSVVQIPVSAGPVCVVYNQPRLSAPLRLSARTLSNIYLGNIYTWQDAAIAQDNPGVSLPKGAIIVVHRSDGSGTTNIFTSYLSQVEPGLVLESGPWPVRNLADGLRRRRQQGCAGHSQKHAGNNRLSGAELRPGEWCPLRLDRERGGPLRPAQPSRRRSRDHELQCGPGERCTHTHCQSARFRSRCLSHRRIELPAHPERRLGFGTAGGRAGLCCLRPDGRTGCSGGTGVCEVAGCGRETRASAAQPIDGQRPAAALASRPT